MKKTKAPMKHLSFKKWCLQQQNLINDKVGVTELTNLNPQRGSSDVKPLQARESSIGEFEIWGQSGLKKEYFIEKYTIYAQTSKLAKFVQKKGIIVLQICKPPC